MALLSLNCYKFYSGDIEEIGSFPSPMWVYASLLLMVTKSAADGNVRRAVNPDYRNVAATDDMRTVARL